MFSSYLCSDLPKLGKFPFQDEVLVQFFELQQGKKITENQDKDWSEWFQIPLLYTRKNVKQCQDATYYSASRWR